ncbi:Do family serine endopeptidase [Paradesertivirga mongoliensis]|uniref:Do family serine endopeptidase n=1 Tax=Paradesertivirga mongoliensis TaxID=2100740 RepID=A0ABW4ZHM4_9SPHI|nr:Do family serine endopeptidase [Pedobacter mongoliensis]
MKKIGITLLTAFIGGAVAIGGYKLIENQNAENMTLEERQNVYFTKNPQNISSAGDVDFVQAAAAVTPAVVHIKTTYDGSSSSRSMEDPFGGMFEEFFGTPRGGGRQRMPQSASGSGVIVTPDGYIVTNNHVVDKASKIEIILPDNRSYTAKVIGTDSNTDLALVKVEAKNLPVIKLGNSDNVRVGEWVLAVGYPLSLQTTVTAGIVSAKGRSIGILNENNQRNYPNREQQTSPVASSAIESFIQTDAAINPGNSGGALVNTEGELIGINTAIASQRGGYEGYGFAIPINLAKKIMDDFIKFGSVKRGFIGVTFRELDASVAKELGVNQISGLYVNEIMEGGGAEAAGLKKGDIITKVDGNKILSSSDLQEKVGRLRPGDKVQLSYLRDGSERSTSVTLKGESSVNIASNSNAANKIIAALGGNFASLTPAQKQKYRVNNGVVVTGVRQGGLLHENQITRGTIITHINGKAVNSLDDIQAAVLASNSNIMRIDGISTDGVRFWGTFEIAR